MTLTSAERIRAYRQRKKESGEPDKTRTYRKEYRRDYKQAHGVSTRMFTGCDGEGCGLDERGRQLYMLFRMGDRELFTGHPLQTREVLLFICSHPRDEILVGFSFGYDVTMILRDLPEKQQRKLFEPKNLGPGYSPYVLFDEFDIQYLPKNY